MKKKKNDQRRSGMESRLQRMEDKLDIIICDLNRIHSRMLRTEREHQQDAMENLIDRLHSTATKMRRQCNDERDTLRRILKGG